MIQFTKLRMTGFKSFVEKTELDIGPGLNGVVGPNGCGKSNLVEALRWVMGESSAKRMRGGGMEDVIFNGTEKRTARNIAEVSILLDNSKRTAPAAWNNTDEIEITRRIERDHGSNYKINGRNVRARDVQILFADTVTGANSPALVSQGRVTQIINSKPFDRRLILEESAGISGLYARRHEAELRLKAADANLLRIEDVLGSMEERLGALKRQARQASRYRNIGAQIRQMEILVAWMEWQALQERMEGSGKKFSEAESQVAEKLGAVTQLTKTQNTQSAELQPLRNKEAEVAATLQTQRLALQRIEDEAGRLEQTKTETQAQIEQVAIDEQHEQQTLQESASLHEKLEQEHQDLTSKQKNDDAHMGQKRKARNDLEGKVVILEEQYTALMQSEAESRARKQSLEQQIAQNGERLEIVRARKEKAQEELKTLEAQERGDHSNKDLEVKTRNLEEELKAHNKELESLQGRQRKAQDNIDKAREAIRAAENKKSELSAEIKMLESYFEAGEGDNFKPVLDDVAADSGFEKALSRALGDALLASLDDNAPVRWVQRKSVDDMPSLPSGAQSLLPHVKAPAELHLALSQIGLVGDEATGENLSADLLPGQALVSKSGTYWRWDGLRVKAEASDRNAMFLEQKNRLKELTKKRPQIEDLAAKAEEVLTRALADRHAVEEKQKEITQTLRRTEETLSQSRAAYTTLLEQQARYQSELTRLQETIRLADEDIGTLTEVIQWDKDRLKAYELETSESKAENIEKIRTALSEAREAHQAAVSAFDMHQQELNSRNARLHAIADERINLQNRTIRARERLKQLEDRKRALSEKLKELKSQPADFAKDKDVLLGRISELESARNDAAEKLAACENDIAQTGKALKVAEAELGEMREARAHAQATLSALKEQQETMLASIREQFDMPPEELEQHSAIDMDKNLGDLDGLRQKKEKLLRERDNIGPVNLRADDEAQELEKEVTVLLSERNDLMQAIEELRGGINKINKEARAKLLGAFEHVNAHFQRLFTRLFGGGQAHLALIDSEDVLGAGLEIFAQPPGKKLQSLSLLSGGEQTLASIALIFAMFLTNPSPICVLDEIDAPLDDANVDRVCDLLEEIAERGETRFLVITHHRMTMARMDRLYGVTMAEKGVSQLVSVDLQQSFNFLEAA
jgi:chromosome segregation protein